MGFNIFYAKTLLASHERYIIPRVIHTKYCVTMFRNLFLISLVVVLASAANLEDGKREENDVLLKEELVRLEAVKGGRSIYNVVFTGVSILDRFV